MKREGTIGAAAFLAIAAVVGVSLQTGPKQEGSGRADRSSAIKRSKPSITKKATHQLGSGCGSLEEQLEEFLNIEGLVAPKECYEPGYTPGPQKDLTQKTSQLKFVIALLPDPVHTHLPVVFDQFAVAIQEGAQDEKYDFDSSWLPWDEEDPPYALLSDQKASNLEKELKENQPGLILFRKTLDCQGDAGKQQSDCKEDLGASAKDEDALSKSYREGLVVFVVGEEATHGIHREQFRNALAWIAALDPKKAFRIKRLAILGPTFSGSFPSLAQVLSEGKITEPLDLGTARDGQRLAIYSGSSSGKDAAQAFQEHFRSQITFHSFLQNDDEISRRFCNYITKEQPGFDPSRVAIISEDETAYGKSGVEAEPNAESDKTQCPDNALRRYYPRDISPLPRAYQTKSLFEVATSPQPGETHKRSLPPDLPVPSGKVHDSIRSYGGNQTPLTQEAVLLEIVAALRALNARSILLRSSNTLYQLFLTNFLRRGDPNRRIVLFGAHL